MEIISTTIFFVAILLDIFLVRQIIFLNKVKKNPNEFCIVRKNSGFRVGVGGAGGNMPSLSPITKIERKASQKDIVSVDPDEIKRIANFSLIASFIVIVSSFFALFLI